MSLGKKTSAGSALKYTALFLLFIFSANLTFAEEKEEGEGKFNPSEMILHHIGDSHEWHIATIGHNHITIPLPIIIYSDKRGLKVFSSARFHGEHGSSVEYDGYKLEHEHITSTDPTEKIYDFSITKNAASMMIGALIIIVVFLSVASAFKKNKGKAPRGLQSFMEPIILFIRDDVALPNLGPKKYMTYLPYLLTLFFFIWINNILGLLPTGANASGNIAFTMVLAVITALITNISGNKSYWGHIFLPPGVPWWLLPLIVPIEIIGILTKPFALMIRLFANITAGHIIILSLISFIFIFESFVVGIPAGLFVVAMMFLELFVAALQAYIFTMLAALFIGLAIAEHEHEEAHH